MTTNPRKRTAETQEEAWVADEDRFVLAQAKKKALLRVKAGRGRPIDLLAVALRTIEPLDSGFEEEDADEEENLLVDPETVFEGLSKTQLGDLEREIDTYLALERNRVPYQYWRTMKLVCNDRQRDLDDDNSSGAASSVTKDLDRILKPKSLAQLEALEKQIKQKLKSHEPIDVDYWEGLLKRLLVHKARAQLRQVSQQITNSRMSRLREEQVRNATAFASRFAAKMATLTSKPTTSADDAFEMEPLLKISKADQSLPIVDEARLDAFLSSEKRRIIARGFVAERSAVQTGTEAEVGPQINGNGTSSAYDREVARGLNEDEEILTTEEPLTQPQRPQWADKYPPRKPRYFNRVQLGYDWNKYNQTHYDQDNPPPKVVQGYRFNIFYPDLIDVTKAPTYRIEREGGRKRGQTLAPAGEEDTCLIRFIAGAPYDELTFRIVDREWDYSAKRERGFRSSFDKGILQLHFQFKKTYYRK